MPVPKTVADSAHPSPTLCASRPGLICGTHLQEGSQYGQAIWADHCLIKVAILGVVVHHVDLEGKHAIRMQDRDLWQVLTPTGLHPARARAGGDMQL